MIDLAVYRPRDTAQGVIAEDPFGDIALEQMIDQFRFHHQGTGEFLRSFALLFQLQADKVA